MIFDLNVLHIILLCSNYLVLCSDFDKIDPKLRLLVEDNLEVNILVWFGSTKEALERVNMALLKTKPNSKAIVSKATYESLNKLATERQRGVLERLTIPQETLSTYHFERLWITNRIFIREADFDLVELVASDPNVTRISEEIIFDLDKVVETELSINLKNGKNKEVTWGLERIQVPEAWEMVGGEEKGGKDVIVGIMDTGCNVEHESIRDNFLGEFGWFDPVHWSEEPEDTKGHGSHVTGIILGKNGIGIAPSAKHSQCRVCDKYCTEKNFDLCAQFFIYPTLPNGSSEDCSKRVDIVNMSFSFGPLPKFDDIIAALRTAGIIPIASAGNKGPNCSTINFPGASKFDVITVGNTDINDKISDNSSRGPSGESQEYKPDVCAPGTEIVSVNWNNLTKGLSVKSGSSMAAAHVSGLVALLLGVDKNLEFENIRKLIIENTDQNLVTNGDKCGGISNSVYPNDFCGYGRINALKVLKAHNKLSSG